VRGSAPHILAQPSETPGVENLLAVNISLLLPQVGLAQPCERDPENPSHLSRVGPEGHRPWQEPHDRRNVKPGARDYVVEPPNELNIARGNPELFFGFAQGGVRRAGIPGINVAARKGHLARMDPQARGATGQNDFVLTGGVVGGPEGNENGSRSPGA
jgi:hypothetical protein